MSVVGRRRAALEQRQRNMELDMSPDNIVAERAS